VTADGQLDQAELDRHCRDSRLANYKRPRAYVFMEQLPRNAGGKVLRRILRDQVAAQPVRVSA